jgi:hypothetical protein
MLLAKLLFTAAVAVLYFAFGWGAYAAFGALAWWQFILALCLYLPPSTFVFYLAGMAYERGKKAGNVPALADYIVMVLKPLAGLHNLANNLLPMQAVFLKISLRPATTKRLNDYVDGPAGWRRDLALHIREQLLNWADPDGIHK